MDETGILKDGHGIEKLSHENFDKLCAKTLKLVLLDEFVEVGREEFEYETEVITVDEGVPETKDVMLIIGIAAFIQEFEDSDLHHTLIKVSRLVFNNLDGDDFMGLHILTFDDLAKSALTEDIENEVSKEDESGRSTN